jgi:ABC-type uncharacterized transport system substrate-binding protein
LVFRYPFVALIFRRTALKHFILACLGIVFAVTTAAASTPTILVVESYESGYSWDRSYLDALQSELGDQFQLTTFEMDTKRLPASDHPRQAEKAWQIYQQIKPQLVILGDDNALKYLGPKLLDSGVPVVYLGVNNNPEDYVPNGHNITGILERPLFEFCLHTIGQVIQPAPKRVLVLFDNGTTSQAAVSEAFKNKPSQLISNMLVELKLIGDWDEWQQTVMAAQQQGFDAIVVGLYHTLVDKQGQNVPASQVLQWTSANTPLPPFTFWDFSIGADQTIGGFVLSGQEQGKAAAGVVRKILNGTAPGKIPPAVGKNGKFVFSRAQLQKWNLTVPEQISRKAEWTD